MRIPLNVIHWYIAWPVALIVAMRSLIVRNKSANTVNTYFGIAAWLTLLCLTFYGLPPLLTLDSQILTICTIIADCLQFTALFFMWLVVVRLYLPNYKVLRYIIGGIDFVIVIIGTALSAYENLANPVTMTLVEGRWELFTAFPFSYQVVTAVQFASLVLIAIKFWSQSRANISAPQKLRLRAFAVAFMVIGGSYVIRPIFTINPTSSTQTLILGAGWLIAGVFTIVTVYLGRNSSNTPS